MPFSKLPLIYQTSKAQEDIRDNSRSLLGSAVRVGLLAPMAYGAYRGFSSLKSNLGTELLHSNRIADMAIDVGQNIQRAHGITEAARIQQGEKFARTLLEGRELENILSGSVARRNEYLAGIVSSLDDSANVTQVKDQLLRALELPEGQLTDDVQKAVRAATQTLVDLGQSDELGRAIGRFGGIGGQLVPPTPFSEQQMASLFPKGRSFSGANELLQAAGGGARTQHLIKRLEAAAGPSANISYHGVWEGSQLSTYAQVRTAEMRKPTRVNLSFASLQGTSKGMTSPIFRVGESAATTHVGSMFYLDMPKAEALMNEGKLLNKAWFGKEMGRYKAGARDTVFMGFGEASMGEFERLSRGDYGRYMSQREIGRFGEFQRELGEKLTRPGGLATGTAAQDPFRKHLQFVAGSKSSNIFVMGLEQVADQGAAMSRLVSHEGSVFGAISQSEIKRSLGEGRITGRASFLLASNAPLNVVRKDLSVGGDAVLLPTTARPRQNIRETQYMASNKAGKRIQALSNSGLIRMWDNNLTYTNSSMGGVQTAYILDVIGEGRRAGLTEGMAYWGMKEGGNPVIQNVLSKTISAPSDIKAPESAVFRELIHRQRQKAGPLTIGSKLIGPGPNKGKVINSVDDFFKMFGAGKAGQAILGMDDMRMVELSRYTGLQGFSLELSEASKAMGRDRFHLGGYLGFSSEGEKGFSMMSKSMNKAMTGDIYSELIGRTGAAESIRRMGLQRGGVLVGSGNQLGKAALHLADQLITGTALAVPQGAFASMDEVYTRALRGTSAIGKIQDAGQRQASYLKKVTANVAEELTRSFAGRTKTNLLAQDIGLIFGAVGARQKGQDFSIGKAFGFGAEEAEKTIRAHLGGGKDFVDKVMKQAQKGWVLGAGYQVPGDPTPIYRQTMGSMEPRSFSFLAHRLQNVLGLPQDQVSDFMTAFLARKGSMGPEIKTLQGFTQMMESMAPVGGPSTGAFRNLPTVSVEDFITGAGGKPETAKAFMSQYEKGFMLDFGDATEKIGGVRRSVGGGNIFFMGDDAIRGMRGTEILQSGGARFGIENELFGKVAGFAENLSQIRSNAYITSQELREAQDRVGKAFKQDVAAMFGQSWAGLLRGKLRGSGFLSGEGIILGPGGSPDISPTQMDKFRNVLRRTRGAAVFADAQGFIDVMSQYRQGVAAEHVSAGVAIKHANKMALNETMGRFERFFLGMERKNTAQGVTGGVGRNPELGPGHRSWAEIYRADFGDVDDVFTKFARTAEGEAAIGRLSRASGAGNITSWRQVAELKDKRIRRIRGKTISDVGVARRSLFRTFINNTSSFMGEGKGRLLFPDMETSVHYTSGHEHKINFSKAAMMVGDFDGDYYNLYMMSERQRKLLKGKSMSATQMLKQSQVEDLVFNAETQQFTQQSKASMTSIAREMEVAMEGKGLTAGQFKAEEALKEHYGKQIGKLDVALDEIRLGMMHSVTNPAEQREAQRALAMMVPLEEIVIKAKKLPRAIPIAEQAVVAMQGLSKGETGPFKRFIDSVLLKDGKKFSAVSKVNVPDYLRGSPLGNEIETAVKSLAKAGNDGVFDMITRGALYARENKTSIKTQLQAAGISMMDTIGKQEGFQRAVWNYQSAQGALMAGEGSTELSRHMANAHARTGTILKGLNSKMLGPLALGAVGTLALGSALGGPGYGSKPMIMPGEISDYRVNAAIAAGGLGGQTSSGPRPDELATPAHMNSVQRPINVGETYFSGNNSYSIRGNSTSLTSLSKMSHFVAGLGGSSSVRINDTRRPITTNYIDRLTND